MSISITPRAWCLAAILAALAPLPALAEQAQDANPLAPGAAAASSVQPNFQGTYDRLDASQEAYERGEAERREAIRRQTQTVEDMVWYSGVPGYAPAPLGLGYVYGMGGWRPIPRAWRVETPYPFPEPVPPAYGYPYPAYPYAFAPWPLVPGDIYGYPYVNRVQQPLGHKVIVTGPNSYIYRPVYPSDLEPPQPPSADVPPPAAPPAAGPVPPPPAPAAAPPVPAPPAQGATREGPQEF